MEKELHRKIVTTTLILSGIGFVISFLLTTDKNIAFGFVFGSLARLAGFEQIVRMVSRIEQNARPKVAATSNYVVRYIFYGIVIWICITHKVNLFTLLCGFCSVNLAIMLITAFENRKGSE